MGFTCIIETTQVQNILGPCMRFLPFSLPILYSQILMGLWNLWLDVQKIFYLRYKNCVAHELRIKKAAKYFAISF